MKISLRTIISIILISTIMMSTSSRTMEEVQKYESGAVLELASGGEMRVVDLGDEIVNEECDFILSEIITLDMDQREMAYAIYQWVEKNIRYSGNTIKGDALRGAKLTFAKRTGDCYSFCSALWALLNRIGIDTIDVTGEDDYHFWVISKIDGEWYYLDATTGWGSERFMLTEKELEDFIYLYNKGRDSLTYEWDKSKYPKTP